MQNSSSKRILSLSVLSLLAFCLLANCAAFAEEAAETVQASAKYFQTYWSLLPAVIAIALALLTREVYSSLFLGIVVGGLLWSDFNFEKTLTHVFNDGIVASLASASNVGILVFLVILGIIVVLMNKAGGSAAFGRWAGENIKSRTGAQLTTIILGMLIFIDDYFNCLTVGSVMHPLSDNTKISRAKLAYLVDATAAPICIIAPVSSWAAAVSSYVEEGNGLDLFIRAIPFNFYAILTIVMMFMLALKDFDYGPMVKYERNAIENGDVFSGMGDEAANPNEHSNPKGIVLDLILPVVVLIVCCIIGMIYSGGYYSGEGKSFVAAFSDADASVGLMLGSAVTLFITFFYYLIRRVLSFKEIAACIPEGFKSMVPAILILTFAWSLKAMTDSLGAKQFVEEVVKNSAAGFQYFLPAIIFVIACFLSFATGTSWGTFGILIPITLGVFPLTDPLGVVCVSACMAGAVCGDHCSPISDTTIMASAGAQCDHVTHVSTQLPYAITVACVSFAAYIIAGFIPNAFIALPIAIALMICTLIIMSKIFGTKAKAN